MKNAVVLVQSFVSNSTAALCILQQNYAIICKISVVRVTDQQKDISMFMQIIRLQLPLFKLHTRAVGTHFDYECILENK